ncbi:hypothetical protein KIW84_031924 [Lathyrus oleraceus]|uniref:Uncharacterized protein n=2 Tax=Pisum sativum TaxID=3888 RepID=A0A9D5B196_PEA|nr:hypothetical protein KIW84_031924 [Pisum sativum]
MLSCFSHANWQLGDWCMLPVEDQKEQIEKMIRDSPDAYLPNKHSTAREYRRRNLNSSMEELFIIGTSDDDDDKASNQRWGVVLSVDAKEHTVNVQWRTVATSKPNDLAGEPTLETVSAYELVEHPDFSCCFGDIVFKTAQKHVGGYRAEKNNANSMSDLNVEVPLIKLNQINYQSKPKDNCHLSHIGNVFGFKDGHVEVKWATGLTTKVAPYEIFRIDKHEGSTATLVSYETNVVDSTQEIIGHGSLFSDQKGKGLLDSLKLAYFKKLGLTSFCGAVSTVPTFGEGNAPDFVGKKDSETCSSDTNSHTASSLPYAEDSTPYCEVYRVHETSNVAVSLNRNCSDQLKQFDVIHICSDHHFFNEGKGLPLSQVKKDWAKKVQQEWKNLKKNLPKYLAFRTWTL